MVLWSLVYGEPLWLSGPGPMVLWSLVYGLPPHVLWPRLYGSMVLNFVTGICTFTIFSLTLQSPPRFVGGYHPCDDHLTDRSTYDH